MDLSILRLEKMEETTIYTQLSVYAGSGVHKYLTTVRTFWKISQSEDCMNYANPNFW